MRGTPYQRIGGDRGGRIIPAYAGNTAFLLRTTGREGDHPRVCGEHATGASMQVNCTGSSPRMRGTLSGLPTGNVDDGIIPAYAGNTHSGRHQWNRFGDHPRVCGEHVTAEVNHYLNQGSSPRMRGTRGGAAEPSRPVGIIPAYAGNTDPNMVKNGELRDHPRVCGEHGVVSSHSMHSRGSSPRMRGTLPSAWRATVCRGIIPAYAGNTSFSEFYNTVDRDHPRVCGEHSGCSQ